MDWWIFGSRTARGHEAMIGTAPFAILKELKAISPALRGTSYAGCQDQIEHNPARVEAMRDIFGIGPTLTG